MNKKKDKIVTCKKQENEINTVVRTYKIDLSSLCSFVQSAKMVWSYFIVLISYLSLFSWSHRSGRRIRKTRKYDIITTPAERVEMAPLNEENDDEDDSTLFDIKYRLVLVSFSFLSYVSTALMRMTKRSNHIEEVRPLIPYGFSGHADHCVWSGRHKLLMYTVALSLKECYLYLSLWTSFCKILTPSSADYKSILLRFCTLKLPTISLFFFLTASSYLTCYNGSHEMFKPWFAYVN